jgi:tetratricopeptide (TPR) repeat protein
VNALLYLVIAGVSVAYWPHLRWAARELPRYLSGSVGSPLERQLTLEAREILERGGDLERARALLERAAAIDPTCDAVYWLGEVHLAAGRADAALAQLERSLALDPTRVEAYVKSAALLASSGRLDEARAVLERGRAYFEGNRERYWPQVDGRVEEPYGRKALDVYRHYTEGALRMSVELERLASRSSTTASGGRPEVSTVSAASR